jgi:antitoxin VapB
MVAHCQIDLCHFIHTVSVDWCIFGIYRSFLESLMDANPFQPARAKLFFHGRSQAVRLPKEFRFEGTEVYVRRVGADVVLSSQPKAPMQNLIDAVNEFESGFVMQRDQPERADERAELFSATKK